MTKRIKHVSELPAWFDLTKYEFTRNLDSLGWFKQLIARELHLIKASSISIEPTNELILKKFVPTIRTHPSLFIEDHTAISLFNLVYPDTPEKEILEQFLGVSQIKSNKFVSKSHIDLYQVNYNFSDEFLIENFKKCLALGRKKHQSIYRKPFQKSDFQHWTKLGILPYIDLFLWAKEEKIHITHRVLANALYPFGDKGEETIRKTTIPLVEEIVSPHTMMQLHAQARTTIVEKNLK